MDLLLILTYAALCIAIFKVFKNPTQQVDGTYSGTWRNSVDRHADFADELQPPVHSNW